MRGSLTAVRLLTLLLFLLLIAVCAYWALQILAPRPAIAPSASIGDAAAAPNLEPATTLFGAAGSAVAVTDSGNIQVSGIAEAGPEGVVILSIDGETATMATPLRYRILPGALRLIVPERAS